MRKRMSTTVGVYELAAFPLGQVREDRTLVTVILIPGRLLAGLSLPTSITSGLGKFFNEPGQHIGALVCPVGGDEDGTRGEVELTPAGESAGAIGPLVRPADAVFVQRTDVQH